MKDGLMTAARFPDGWRLFAIVAAGSFAGTILARVVLDTV